MGGNNSKNENDTLNWKNIKAPWQQDNFLENCLIKLIL